MAEEGQQGPAGAEVRCRVLIVDDMVDFAIALAKRLEHRGFQTTLAHDGERALEVARAARPDVVVLDVRMPGLDGIETLQRLKADDPDVQVILLTGHASVRSGIEGMRLGAFDYLVKPADIDKLCERILAALAQRNQGDPVTRSR